MRTRLLIDLFSGREKIGREKNPMKISAYDNRLSGIANCGKQKSDGSPVRRQSRGDGKFLRRDYQEAERAVHEYGDSPIKG